MITPNQLGTLVNLAGYAVPLAFSFTIARAYFRPYFWHWSFSYFFYSLSIAVLNFVGGATPALPAALVITVEYQLGTWFILRTAETIPGAKGPSRPNRWLLAGVTVLTTALLLAGQPFLVAATGVVLLLTWMHGVLCVALLRLPRPAGSHGHQWLAAFVAMVGLWVLVFPVIHNTPWEWLGYVVSGVLHLVTGIQMVIFLLEDVAYQQQQQVETLRQLDLLKSNFLSTVSHELRTPLTAIKSAVWLLDSPLPPESMAEVRALIDQQTDVLTHVVGDMVDFSQLESGTMTYRKDRLCLADLAQMTVDGLRERFEEKAIALTLETSGAPIEVTADGDRLGQALTHLLTNALKFSPPGSHVTVRLATEPGQARVEVADDGPGIPPEHLAKIFDRFYQVDNTSTRKVGGAGLGLAIARAIVEDGHQGKLWVESRPGEGSTFIFTLPA